MNGWIIVNKPVDISSAKVVAIIKRIFKATKVGHAGTLDPFASGVLPIAIGEATKTTSFILNSCKEYRFSVKFGSQTSTDDIEGDIIAVSGYIPTEDDLLRIIPNFVGKITQIPPIYSAIKLQGQPAYARARKGELIEMQSREVVIKKLGLISYENGIAVFEVACGSGTYVRALGRDIAFAANSVGHLVQLERTLVANFEISNAVDLDFIKSCAIEDLNNLLLPIGVVVAHLPMLHVDEACAQKISFGQKVRTSIHNSELITVWYGKNLVAIASIENFICKSIRVFNF